MLKPLDGRCGSYCCPRCDIVHGLRFDDRNELVNSGVGLGQCFSLAFGTARHGDGGDEQVDPCAHESFGPKISIQMMGIGESP